MVASFGKFEAATYRRAPPLRDGQAPGSRGSCQDCCVKSPYL